MKRKRFFAGAVSLFILLALLYALDISNGNVRSGHPGDFQPPAVDSIPDANPISTKIPTLPLDRPVERVTKKPFGVHITPGTSPVQPERFSGFHTGTDFEIFPRETNADVPVHAICGGVILEKKKASGYGGVIVTSGIISNTDVTVVYGHLRLSSISSSTGDSVHPSDVIGVLGTGYSDETDGERKHLHLSIHKGRAVNIRGYVSSKADLESWIDPMTWIRSHPKKEPAESH